MAFKMEQLIGIGILVIIIGFIIVFLGALGALKDGKSNTKVAVGGFIGPIPFGFGNDKSLVKTVLIISAVILVLWFIFSLKPK